MDSASPDQVWPYVERRLTTFRWGIFLLGLCVALFTTFVLWSYQGLVDQAHDIYLFGMAGKHIAAGEGLRFDTGPPTIRRAPLYPILIGSLYFLFGEHPVLVQAVQCLFAAGTCLLAFEIGRRVFTPRTGLLAGIATAFHPLVMRYVPDIQVECFLTFLYTLTVYTTVRLIEHESLLNGFWVGASAAAASMVKGVALPYAALFFVAYLLYRRLTRSSDEAKFPGIGPMAALVVAMGLVILPWTYRNYQVTDGRFVLISGNAAGEFLRGYVFAQPKYYLLQARAYTDGENEADEMQRALHRAKGLVREADETATEMVYNEAAKKKLKEDPGALVKKVFIAWFMFWYVTTTAKNSIIVGVMALGAWVLAGIGWWRSRGQGYKFWLLLLPIFSLNLIYALILALGRYSAPIIPTLMVLAAFGVNTLLPSRLGAKPEAKA